MEKEEEPAEIKTCPITLDAFQQPVYSVDDGYTYERSAFETWLSRNPTTSPIGFPLKNGKYVSNHAMTQSNPVCPITKEPFRDPIILEEDGFTYEHDALLEHVKRTLCQYKKTRLASGLCLDKITPHPNKSLWNDAYAKERKPFVFPEKMKVLGYNSNIPKTKEISHVVLNMPSEKDVSDEDANISFTECTFKGCFKQMVLTNCRFVNCIFDCCSSAQFMNCSFNGCIFLNRFHNEWSIVGSSFRHCLGRLKHFNFEMSKNEKLFMKIEMNHPSFVSLLKTFQRGDFPLQIDML